MIREIRNLKKEGIPKFTDAVALLENGEYEMAKKALEPIILENEHDTVASRLIDFIDDEIQVVGS